MAQPQISLNDYFGGKSVVLRAIPEDFFKPYSEFLTQFSGKWNPHLKHPSGQEGVKLAGWIFPKTKEEQVRQAITQILSGSVPTQSRAPTPGLSQGQVHTLNTLGAQPPVNTLQQLLSAAQARTMAQAPAGNQSPVFTSSTPIGTLPPVEGTPVGTAPPGYQQVTYVVIKPEIGGTLQLMTNGQKVAAKVESVETQNGITNKAVIQLPDGQRTYIRLMNDQWLIPKFDEPHSISLQ